MEPLLAPSHWRCIDFISDLHLQASESSTYTAWRDYLQHTAADAVFILGDLFEVWVGDDVLLESGSFESACVEKLHQAAKRLDVFIMHGNRDFLMGPQLLQACGASFLQDPTVLSFAAQRYLLTHGDALCLSDTAYMQFRHTVRGASWQSDFLAQPLAQRKDLARQLRAQSDALKRHSTEYADVDATAAIAWLHSNKAATMVHGHTHRPDRHALGQSCERIVLSDWDLDAHPPRAEVLRIRLSTSAAAGEATVERISPAQASFIGARPGG